MTPKHPPVPHPSKDPGTSLPQAADSWFVVSVASFVAGLLTFLFFWMLPMGVFSEVFNGDLANAEGGVEVWAEWTYRADLDMVLYTLLFDCAVVVILTTIALSTIKGLERTPGEKDPRKYSPNYRKAR